MTDSNPYEVHALPAEQHAPGDDGVSSFSYSLRIHIAAYAGTTWAGALFGAGVAISTGIVGFIPGGSLVGVAVAALLGVVVFIVSFLSSLAIPQQAWIAATLGGLVTGVASTYLLLHESSQWALACIVAGVLGAFAAYWRAVREMQLLKLRPRRSVY